MFYFNQYEYRGHEFTEIGNGDMKVTFSSLGASIYKLMYCGEMMTLTPSSYDDFFKFDCFYGKTIGPFVNRIYDGIIEGNGIKLTFPLNEPTASLHGGPYGFSTQNFTSKLYLEQDFARIDYHLQTKDTLDLVVSYFVYKDKLDIKYYAVALNKTVCSLTNHIYFNLGTTRLKDLSLEIKAHQYVVTDVALIPTELVDIDPKYDFNEMRPLERVIFDNSFKLDDHIIKLQSDKYQVLIDTNYEYAQVYTDNYIDNVHVLSSEKKNHRSLSIEPEDNLLNRKILNKGERYERFISYQFSKVEPKQEEKAE